MALTWSKQMSVANEAMDSDHKIILDKVNDIETVLKAKNAAALMQEFNLLEEYVRSHFRNETRLAEVIDYPFEQHKLEHQYVLNELDAMKKELLEKNGKWSESEAEYYFSFLSEWATVHIREDDMKMKATLETYPYDFKPPA